MRIHELTGAWGTARVAELGGCVLSWRPRGGDDVLFVSAEAALTPGDMWHGGIPVCAPWFGAGRGDWVVPHSHGLVSRVPWRTDLVEQSDDRAKVVMTLGSADVAHLPGADRYPDDLGYRLDICMDASALTATLTITSPSSSVVVDQAFHPYLRVDATTVTVTGLEGVGFQDAADGWAPGSHDEPLTFDGRTDLVYESAPPVFINDGVRTRRLSSHGASRTVVWNPGEGNDQLPGDEWRQFICVEFGNVRTGAVTIPAGGVHRLAMTIEV
ncbi:D-hexose-6-phosphate mutarotase [Tessaracoccus lubricantis]|uniref:D-hexose-6-phosphate mutarotase n=1 Tax=Tessaracoccus lubricantis TaxID=545543 RepID=A0ABP9F9Y9_9ACTN